MKILLIVPEYPPYHIGGGGVVFQNIAEHLTNKGHNVTVAYGYHPTRFFFEKPKFSKSTNIMLLALPLIPTPKSKILLTTVMPPNIRSIITIIKLIYHTNADVIHLHGYGFLLIDFSSILCRMFNKKYIVTLHGVPKTPARNRGLLNLVFKLYSNTLGKHTLVYSKKITCVSRSVANEPIFFKFNNKVQIIFNGINLEEYKVIDNFDIRNEYDVPRNACIISSFGRLQWLKGFQYAIEAINLILKEEPNIIYLIAGKDGGYQNPLKELIDKSNLNGKVIFTGFLDKEKKKCLIFNSKVVLIPSLEESFGLVGLEAMAIGTPIISSNVGGLGEYLEDNKTALIINPYNPQEIKEKLLILFNDAELCTYIVKNGFQKVQNFEWHSIINKYIKIYSEV